VSSASDVVACPSCGKRNRVPDAAAGAPRCAVCHHALPWVTAADDASFARVAEQSRLPVVLDLWAPWCGPCRTMAPDLEQVASDLAGKVKVVKVNVDESPHVARRFDARSIPTLVLLDGGQVVQRTVGAQPAHALRTWITTSLQGRP
jgi:thioredoxin 2